MKVLQTSVTHLTITSGNSSHLLAAGNGILRMSRSLVFFSPSDHLMYFWFSANKELLINNHSATPPARPCPPPLPKHCSFNFYATREEQKNFNQIQTSAKLCLDSKVLLIMSGINSTIHCICMLTVCVCVCKRECVSHINKQSKGQINTRSLHTAGIIHELSR